MALTHEIRFALRGLMRRPGYAVVALLTIAIGIAVNTSIFSVVRAVLLRPLPYEHPASLTVFRQRSAATGFYISVSIPNYRDWGQTARSFQHYGADAGWGWVLTGRGPAELVNGRAVLGEFFQTLGVKPVLGRLIPAAETEPGAPLNVVLGYGFWQRQFGGDSAALGQTLVLNEQPYTVVGVLPQGWGWPNPTQEVYVPMGTIPNLPWDDRGSSFGTGIVARLAPGVTFDLARQDLDRVGRVVAEQAADGAAIPELHSATEQFVGDVKTPLYALLGGVAFVLLIAVANVANLQLARGEERRHEVAVRTALGAGRRRLVRQMLVESLVLSGVGGVLGVALAFAGVRALIPILPSGIPDALLARIGIDPVVLVFAVVLIVATGVLFGVVPALRATRVDPVHEMKNEGRTIAGRGRLRQSLVVAEVALAMVLLIGAGLMVRSLDALRSTDKGFDPEHVLAARMALPNKYADSTSWIQFHEQLVGDLQRLPGVEHAAVSLLVPLTGRSWEMRAAPEGVALDSAQRTSFLFNMVSDDYFQTLGVPLLEGRGFTPADRRDATPVAVVDERMAERFWPGESAVGKRIFLGDLAGGTMHDNPIPMYRTIVGVVKNVRHYELQEPSRVQGYIPFRQAYHRWGVGLSLMVRTAGDPAARASQVRNALAAVDPDVPLYQTRTLQSVVDDALSANRSMGKLFTLFGALALALAGIGIFGVMSYTVAQRTRELGIRMALGANARDVLRSVLGRGMTVAGLGVAIGLVVTPPLTRLVSGLLFGVRPFDAATYAALALFLLAVAGLAAYLPARRATRVDPVIVLKEQ